MPHLPQNRMFAGKTPPHLGHTRSACWGMWFGVLVTNPAGIDERGSSIAGVIFSPHLPQNREFAGSEVEQRGHGKFPGCSPELTNTNDRLPQRPQNLTPSANREVHWAHATIPGMMLEPIPLLACLPRARAGFPPRGRNATGPE